MEFDWCCVGALRTARELGYETILINHNPETVSTDFDVCDRLIFDEISLETVLEVCRREEPIGVIVSVGGQVANNLAVALAAEGVPILGTPPDRIDNAEDRHRFSSLCDRAGIDQPAWTEYTGDQDLDRVAERVGYPVLVRPSYVLSGAAMRVVNDREHLQSFLERAALVSPDYPVVISHYETGAKEIEIDAVADQGEILVWAISEHVENAGVHSGDATLVLPPQRLYLETIRRIKRIARRMAKELEITGPFNIQFLARDNHIKVIECNLRASRSVPFVSKATKVDYIALATRAMLGRTPPVAENRALDLDYVAVKAAQFSFTRLPGADPTLGVEMASTGEVGCFGDDLDEALLKSLLSTGFRRPSAGVLVAIGSDREKEAFVPYARHIEEMGLSLHATPGTARILESAGVTTCPVYKIREARSPSATDVIREGKVDLVINVSETFSDVEAKDGFAIRRTAVDHGVPLVTNLQLARALILALFRKGDEELYAKPWSEYQP